MSWNVNGLQACVEKDFESAITELNPDIVCIQETKTKKKELNILQDYYQIWNNARTSGYSGVLVLTKVEPITNRGGFGIEEFDIEGRVLTLEYPDFYLINVYVPQSKNSLQKADFRRRWDKHFREYIQTFKKPVIMCGDFNIGHSSIDIMSETSKDNPQEDGFEQLDRENFDNLLNLGYVDVFRKKHPDKAKYTCWSNKRYNKTRSMDKRLDYFLLPPDMLPKVKKISMHYHIKSSDHCPITMILKTNFTFRRSNKDKKLAELWDNADWEFFEKTLFQRQKAIATAVLNQDYTKVTSLQERIVHSFSARMLAVRHVCKSSSEAGIDGTVWSTSSRKMESVHLLNEKKYVSKAFRSVVIHDKNSPKERRINIPTYFDRAMQTLHSYTLAPVVESNADKCSFGFRKGRSAMDAAYYVNKALCDSEKSLWVLRCDVKSFYDTISHQWLMKNLPVNRIFLHEFLKSGFTLDGILNESVEGISQGGTCSDLIGNYVLDGLQKHILKSLYKEKWDKEDYKTGKMVRFADDFIVVSENKQTVKLIRLAIEEFLEERGLRLSEEKTVLVKAIDGFDFLSYHFRQSGYFCTVTPADKAIHTYEERLRKIILGSKESLDTLIRTLNKSLQGFGTYHRIHDCEKVFRHFDVVVQALLVKKIKLLHPKVTWAKLKMRYWYRTLKADYIFTHPDNKALEVLSLSKILMRNHPAVREDFNYFLDEGYYKKLETQRNIQKVSGKKNKGLWNGQDGHCFYCGRVMLPDQLLALVKVGDNDQYIHDFCRNTMFEYVETDEYAQGLNVFHLLESVLYFQHEKQDPYYSLRQYFLEQTKQKFTLTFEQIEKINGEPLPWQSKFTPRFWYDVGFGYWGSDDDFPSESIQYPDDEVKIAGAWIENGYKIISLDRGLGKIIFQKENIAIKKLNIPRRLVEAKISKQAAHELETHFKYIMDKYGY